MKNIEFTSETGISINFDQDALCCIAQVPFEFTEPDKVKLEKPIQILGTGFYLASETVVFTAKHIFTDSDPDYGLYMVFNLSSNGDAGLAGYSAVINEIRTHGASDFAALIIDPGQSPSMTPFLLGDHNRAFDGGVFSIGYTPSASLVTNKSWKCRLTINHSPEIKIEERTRSKQPPEYIIEFDSPLIEPGNSGGPILDKDGRVVGVISQRSSGWTFGSESNCNKSICQGTSLWPLADLSPEMSELKKLYPELVSWFTGENPNIDHLKNTFNQLTPEEFAKIEELIIKGGRPKE